MSEHTTLAYFTDTMLLQEILLDPLLSRYSVVVVDEVHERSTQSDTLLGLLRQILMHRLYDFRVIVMSATADVPFLTSYFNTEKSDESTVSTGETVANSIFGPPGHIHVSDRPHEVDIIYLQVRLSVSLSLCLSVSLSCPLCFSH